MLTLALADWISIRSGAVWFSTHATIAAKITELKGELWMRVPPTIKVNLTGHLREPVASKDVVLSLIGQMGDDGARYQAVEFGGPAITLMRD